MNMIDITQLKKPNIFQIYIGTFFLFMKNNKKQPITPQKIGREYYLVSEITKKEFPKFALGVYTDGKKKFFIKTWMGKIKDLNYYSLFNEFQINTILCKKIAASSYKGTINVPKVEDVLQTKDSLSIVFEYVEGKSLRKFPPSEQAEVLSRSRKMFKDISETFTREEENIFVRRSLMFYIFSLPIITFLLIISHPQYTSKVLNSFFRSFLSFNELRNQKLIIAHRDLNSENIIIKDPTVYIIDFERAALTLPQYDLTYLSVQSDFDVLKNNDLTYRTFIGNKFLKTYMAIHFAFSSGDVPYLQSHYLSLLN